MKRHIKSIAVLTGTALAFGCADVEEPVSPVGPGTSASTNQLQSAQQTQLSELTHAVALALGDQGLRQRVKSDLRNSRNTVEHKLEFRMYVHGVSGGILLAKMANETGRSRDDLLALVEAVGPLEFYMPVTQHRESWRGGDNLLVAGSLDEANTTLVGYDLNGRSVSLSPTDAPEIPTLVLVPIETDFSKVLDPVRYRNRNDQGGESIGTYAECNPETTDCGGGGGGGGGGTPVDPNRVQRRGVSVEEFIDRMKTPNDHEPWNLGAPEFYLLLAGGYAGGGEFSNRINIPEGPWSGSDDDNNSKWRTFDPISLITWDTDLGTRIKVQCFESDLTWNTTHTITGSTTIPGTGVEVSYSIEFDIGSGDDNCGSSFINLQNTLSQFYYIPNGVNDDLTNPAPPYYDGTSDLHWHGYGLKRL